MSPLNTNVDWVDAMSSMNERGCDHVLITVLGARGSTPRDNGTKMVVSRESSFGTIGGGHLELKAMEVAAQLLQQEQESQRIEYFPLGAALGQCCGGSTTVLFERFKGHGFNIMLFGTGHVGMAVADILKQLPCQLHWVDSRDGSHPSPLPNCVTPIASDTPAREVTTMPKGSYYLIMTHNHQVDFEILEAILQRDDAAYIGLIGSTTKWQRFKMRLEHRGHPAAVHEQVHCPIGLAEVPGKRPIEVAVSIAGQLIAHRHQGHSEANKDNGISMREAQRAQQKITSESP